VSFDFSKIKKLFSVSSQKRNAILLTTLLVLIPVLLTIYVRMLPQYLPVTDQWATNSVNSYFKNQIAQSVNAQYPNLPAQNKETLINQQFADFQKNNAEMLNQQVKSTSDFFRTGFRYQENNVTYTFLGDLDSYFFLRYARNLLDKGTTCDEIKDGVCWDNHMLAPMGLEIEHSLHPYGIFYLYKFLHMINPTINPMQTSFLLPTFLAVIAAIATFFVGKKIMNTTAGFFAAMFLALSPMFLSRTLGSDTDIWNIMFPIIILWIFLEAFETKSLLKKSILAATAGLFAGFFSFAWSNGWWYIFDFIVVTLITYIAFALLRNLMQRKSGKKIFDADIKSTLIMLGVLIVFSGLFVSLFNSFEIFHRSVTDPFVRTVRFKEATHADYWPNIQTTVAEMNEASISTIVSQTAFGRNILFSLALLGVIFTLVSKKPSIKEYIIIIISAFVFLLLTSNAGLNNLTTYVYLLVLLIPVAIAGIMLLKEKDSDVDIKPAILLIIWFVGMIFASTKGVRFIMLVIPAFAVSLGVAIGYVYQYLSSIISKEFKISETVVKVCMFALLCLLLILPVRVGISAGESFVPSMTKGWWDSLTKIREESQPNAIINSWWDFGHWFKYVADRPVTVDGLGQDYQLAHWMGTILVTDDEHQAINTIRMLDCGSKQSYTALYNDTKDVLLSVSLLKKIIMQDNKEEVRKTLEQAGISQPAIEKTLGYVLCEPPEHFFITSEDMVGKAGVWAHFGYWNFTKAFIIREVKSLNLEEGVKLVREKFNYTEDQATSLYYDIQTLDSERAMNDWISPWPNYLTSNWVGCKEMNETKNTSTANATNDTTAGEVNHLLVCQLNAAVSESQGSRTVLEYAVVNLDDYKKSNILVGSYDTATGYRRGSGVIQPNAFVLAKNETMDRVSMENATFPFDVLVDMVDQRALLVDPKLSESLFTKLFYLDGRYTTHFEKFNDVTDITGSRIIIWKVKWQ